MKLYKPEYVYQEGSFCIPYGSADGEWENQRDCIIQRTETKYPMAREVIMDGEVMVQDLR